MHVFFCAGPDNGFSTYQIHATLIFS